MIIKPRIKGFVCITSHPSGCLENVRQQAELALHTNLPEGNCPKRVLVLGASTGYGLASRISAAFSCKALTLGVSFEREPKEEKAASAGYYNIAAFQKLAREHGLVAEDINGDAFSDECKNEVIEKAKQMGGHVDLVIYSLASPRRTDPTDGQTYRACLKPVGMIYKNKTLDTDRKEVKEVTINPATEDEISHTEKVMGGEDWALWTKRLTDEGLLAKGCINLAYSYIGPEVTWPIYRNGTIGRAKAHLEKTANTLNELMQNSCSGNAYVSVNKAVVTQASSAIPIMPLYLAMLFKEMKQKGTHEGCIEQLYRLLTECLYHDNPRVDDEGRLRVDELEMDPTIQETVATNWASITDANLAQLADFESYKKEFLNLFGFEIEGVDYEADVDPEVEISNLV